MSIESSLNNLINPPKMKFPNYNPSSKSQLKNFSKFQNSFLSHDKTKIVFSLYKNLTRSNSQKTCIIYTHSHGSSSQEGLEILDSCGLFEMSLCVYDSRGCGDSGESPHTFGEKESIDLLYLMFYCAVMDGFSEFIFDNQRIKYRSLINARHC